MDFPKGQYNIIYADPPWDYRGRKQHGFAGDVGIDTGGAVNHYPTMGVKELGELPVASIAADDCLLFMWITNPLVPDGLTVAEAWGFKYGTVAFVWHKEATNPGFYTLSQCELCFVFKKGRIPTPRGSRTIRQFHSEKRTKHSRKPDEIRNRITAMFPAQSKIELFARERHEGWDAWGNEV